MISAALQPYTHTIRAQHRYGRIIGRENGVDSKAKPAGKKGKRFVQFRTGHHHFCGLDQAGRVGVHNLVLFLTDGVGYRQSVARFALALIFLLYSAGFCYTALAGGLQ
jgi:hypothetical protein